MNGWIRYLLVFCDEIFRKTPNDGRLHKGFIMEDMVRVLTLVILVLQLIVMLRMIG